MVELTEDNLQDIAGAAVTKLSETSDSAANLGTVSDIWVLLVLIIPGFITLKIITWFAKEQITLTQFLYTVYSLIISVGLVVILASLGIDDVKISGIDDIRIHAADPNVIAILFGLAIAFGITFGFITRFIVYRNKFGGSAWDEFVKRNVTKFVKVYAIYKNEEHIISGYIKTASTGNTEKKELTLGNPAVKDGNNWIPLKDGTSEIDEVYLPEGSIKRIEHYKPVNL